MKVHAEIVGESHDDVVAKAEALADQLAGEAPRVVKYFPGHAASVDVRPGPFRGPARPEDMRVRFTVPVVIDTGDDLAAEEEADL